MRFAAALTVVLFVACVLPLHEQSARQPVRIIHTPFDEYGNVCWENEQARLDNFSIQLHNDPKLVGYIVVYMGRISCRDEAKYRGNRARNYVIKRGVDPKRVIFKDGGFQPDIHTVLRLQPKTFPDFVPEPTLKKDEVSIRGCIDKVFARVLCLNGNQRIK